MEPNIGEAVVAKEIAEKRFAERDFTGAKDYALKAKTLYPGLEGISQMVATFEVYIASQAKCNGEIDYFSVLGLKPSADKDAVKRQYRKMAVLLHPDKNKTVGADGAFKLVSEAWTMLSDSLKKNSYDVKRNKKMASCVVQTNLSSVHATGVAGFSHCSNSPTAHGLDTFWTVCTSCKVQYEYLRKYVNKRLSCKNCRGIFIAVETGAAPVSGSFPYCPWSYVPGNGHRSHGYDGLAYVPTTSTLYSGNEVSGLHTGHGYEYVSNLSFQWSSFSGTSGSVVGPNGSCAVSADTAYQANGSASAAKVKPAANGRRSMKTATAKIHSDVSANCNESSGSKAGRPDKKRKDAKLSGPTEVSTRRISIAPAFDARKLLIDKARTDIREKLEEMRLASAAAAAAAVKENTEDQSTEATEAPKQADLDVAGRQTKPYKIGPISITVPDPDFHDFDKDRAEECFKPKQIWALYDEDDGMPRLYCLIRQVVSVKPFKILITYLNSKTDGEFGAVNIFSHVLKGEKAGRGGCVRIYPKSGDVWAVYRNWSTDWNRSTPDDVRHQYEMVEVLDNYSEELGVCVTPLNKLAGFKTVYQRNAGKDAMRWIPRKEMVRFSHQVPSWSLEGEASNLQGKCWDLDPAATPDELLHAAAEAKA
ncbi:hypothetical protein OIU77_011080 [Salix suchowensis]|uniref:J domain-containing protein n=1 Tax=Salix suchowensis TaxID=1278906 RepID=A0ABQ9AAI5_9ROSI|nr:hypothetical protein OIU77_011080 [Salix suchowensis]